MVEKLIYPMPASFSFTVWKHLPLLAARKKRTHKDPWLCLICVIFFVVLLLSSLSLLLHTVQGVLKKPVLCCVLISSN